MLEKKICWRERSSKLNVYNQQDINDYHSSSSQQSQKQSNMHADRSNCEQNSAYQEMTNTEIAYLKPWAPKFYGCMTSISSTSSVNEQD